jgi:hypothetical protein
MADFTSIKALEDYLNTFVQIALVDNVKPKIAEIVDNHVWLDVYPRYNPKDYDRRYGSTPLSIGYKDNLISVNDTGAKVNMPYLSHDGGYVLNLKKDARNEFWGTDIVPIIEYGIGYDWKKSKIFKMQPFPRPFIKNAVAEIKDYNLHLKAMKEGLSPFVKSSSITY